MADSILLSAYNCNPYGASEAYTGAAWAVMLAKRYPVIVATRAKWADRMTSYVETLDPAIASNIELHPIEMPDVDRVVGPLRAFSPGYAVYESRLMATVKRQPELKRRIGLVIRKVPASFRFSSRLYRLGYPLVLGPLSGGVKPPPAFREYFRSESKMLKLRAFDRVLMSSRIHTRYLDHATVILVASDNVKDCLPSRVLPKVRSVPDTGVAHAPSPPKAPPAGPFTAMFCGRLERYKAPTLAIQGFARFVERSGMHDALLVMVGDGPEQTECERIAAAEGVSAQVRFDGWLTRDEVLARYEHTHVLLFPSLKEAFGHVYLEAMSCARPLVVVDHGGGHYVPCDAAAFKISPESEESVVAGIADALERLAADSDLARHMGIAGWECVRENYSWDAIQEKVFAIVDEVMDSRRPS